MFCYHLSKERRQGVTMVENVENLRYVISKHSSNRVCRKKDEQQFFSYNLAVISFRSYKEISQHEMETYLTRLGICILPFFSLLMQLCFLRNEIICLFEYINLVLS